MNLANDKLLLNYNDACIYFSDLSILKNPSAWLNDACINFQITRLQQKEEDKLKVKASSSTKNDDISLSSNFSFLDPCVVSYLMHQCQDDDEIIDLSNNLKLNQKQALFIPINDNNGQSFQSTTLGNGTHWSLLLVLLFGSKLYFLHFDSSKRYNCAAARAVSKKISYLLMLSEHYHGDAEVVSVIECKTPQQRNGYDCGIYVIALAEMLSSSEEIRKMFPKDGTMVVTIQEFAKCCEKVIDGIDADIHFGVNVRERVANDIKALIEMKEEKKGLYL